MGRAGSRLLMPSAGGESRSRQHYGFRALWELPVVFLHNGLEVEAEQNQRNALLELCIHYTSAPVFFESLAFRNVLVRQRRPWRTTRQPYRARV